MTKQEQHANHMRASTALSLCRDLRVLRNIGTVLPWQSRAMRKKAQAIKKLADSIINEGYKDLALQTVEFQAY